MDFGLDIPVHFPRCCKKGYNSESESYTTNANLGPLVPPMARVLLGRTRNYEKKIIFLSLHIYIGLKGNFSCPGRVNLRARGVHLN